MQVVIKSQFEKQLLKLNNQQLSSKIFDLITEISDLRSLSDIANLKKLKGYKTVYRIRVGDYRIGVVFENEILNFAAIGMRKDFYTKFP